MNRIPLFVILCLCFMLGANCSIISPDVLEFLPGANTTFTCLGREGDEESRLTFAINGSVYGLDELGPNVKFVYQSRIPQDGRLNITTTLIFLDGANGSTLRCCYIVGSGTCISRGEDLLLFCLCPSQGEITTVPLPLDTTTERSRSIVVNSSEISFEVDTSSHNNKFVIGIVIAGTVAALVILCITICAVYLCTKCRKKQLTERNTNPSPCMEAIQETEKPASPMLKERDNLVRRQPRGTATTRDEVTFSTTANDDMRSITIPMPAEHEESVMDKEKLTKRTTYTSDSEDKDAEMPSWCHCLIFDPRSRTYFSRRDSKEVHTVSELPLTRVPTDLQNKDIDVAETTTANVHLVLYEN